MLGIYATTGGFKTSGYDLTITPILFYQVGHLSSHCGHCMTWVCYQVRTGLCVIGSSGKIGFDSLVKAIPVAR